ncbi:hypothetical protein FDC58_15690 [Clostridium botulinum]|nr:hypothetical protein [Clostridium botulinum]NFO87906.1 hypothetical protein [Clostridium botulinum]NFP30639.1 hypothetical protein [Clostridium botulinum]NFS95850.1 hypothetical protein [Clostridium botulinum]
MANSIEYTTLFQKNLDKAMEQKSVTGWMEANAGQVIYNGGKTVKIPKMSFDGGLTNYDRTDGYGNAGSVSLEYEERTMTYDRSKRFNIDSMDVDESNFIVTAGTTMGEFQRLHVVPEVDAIRLSTLAQKGIANEMVKYSFTPNKTNVVDEFKDAIAQLRDTGYEGRILCHCTNTFKAQLEKAFAGQISPATLTLGGVDTTIPSIDGVLLIPTASSRMYTKYIINDGKAKKGFEKDEKALSMNFILVGETVPIAISKTDKVKTIMPEANQTYDGYSTYYRKYHDIWVMDNASKAIYVNIKEAKPTESK